MQINKRIVTATAILLLLMIPLYIYIHDSGTDKKVSDAQTVKKVTEVKNLEAEGVEKADNVGESTKEKWDSQNAAASEATANQEDSSASSDSTALEIAASDETKKDEFNDFVVVIDPGHQLRANLEKEPVGPGASDLKLKVSGGTTGVATKKPEYVLTLEASLILGELLEKNGVKVMYTRTTHNINMSNRERAEMANQNKADLFVRIHADGAGDPNVSGLSVLTPASNSPYTTAIYQDSLHASQLIIDQTKLNSTVKVNGVKFRSDLSGFNWSQVPSTLVEMGYMTNPAEDKKLSDKEYLTSLLSNVADGILQYAHSKSE